MRTIYSDCTVTEFIDLLQDLLSTDARSTTKVRVNGIESFTLKEDVDYSNSKSEPVLLITYKPLD